jgi:TrmH family RNA methyltransferase
LENLQDPSNLGAISRTAEAFGLDGIFLKGGCDPYSPKSLRASMGALLRIPVYQTHDLFKEFDKAGLVSYAAVIDKDAQKLGTVSFAPGSVVIIGNEANGIAKETIARCDNRITIPMDGKAESLNAAIAASIIMWEMCK